jgi:hypothetical protein
MLDVKACVELMSGAIWVRDRLREPAREEQRNGIRR